MIKSPEDFFEFEDDDAFVSAYEQLRPAEKVFVDGYLSNPLKPAKSGGAAVKQIEGKDYSSDYATAQVMLARPIVRAAIFQRRQDIANQVDINAANIMREIALLAFSNMADFVDESGDLNLLMLARQKWAAVKSIKKVESLNKDGEVVRTTTTLELHPKLAALTALLDYLKEYAPDLVKSLSEGMSDNPSSDYAKLINHV